MPSRNPIRMPQLPQVQDPALQQYINGLHEVIESLLYSGQVPNAPTNLTVTPVAGGNVIQFTRSNAVTYALYMSDSPDRARATQVSLGSAAQFTDTVGAGAVTRYYWVVGLNQTGALSSVIGPVFGVTLALGSPTTVLPLPTPSFAQVFDTTINRNRPVLPATDPTVAGQPSEPVIP